MEAIPIPTNPRFKNLTMQKFGRWAVISYAGSDHHGNGQWNCRCTCGAEKVVHGNRLKSGESTSCGCYQSEVISALNTTHGQSRTAVYLVWKAMINRCSNPKNRVYPLYGGRGITVCERWLVFEQFVEDMGDPQGMTLERRENSKGYSKENCIWATVEMQANNRRTNINVVSIDGRQQTVAQWCRELGVSRKLFTTRLGL